MAELGAQLYTLRDYMQTLPDIEKSLNKVSKIGYKAVQLSGHGPVDPWDIAGLLKDNDLTAAATHTDWDRFLNDLSGVISDHKIWDCRHAAIGGLPEKYYNEKGLAQFLKELTPVAKSLNSEGMDFSYHNHSHELVRYGDKTWLQMLYEQADPDYLKAEIDTYWIQHGGGDPAYWVGKMAGRQPLLHLKDMIITKSREQRYAEIGEGNLNWPAILDAAGQGDVEWYLIEQDNCYERDPFESLAISYRYLCSFGLS